MLKQILFSCALLLFTSAAFAQKPHPAGEISAKDLEKLKAYEDTLAILAYAIVNDSIELERFAACRVFIPTLVKALKIENSFNYKFERLNTISMQTPPDSSFRIFTWQLFVNDSTYKYYGAIQMNNTQLKLFALSDKSAEMDIAPVREQLPPDRWYGALYYNLRQFDTKEGRKYLLLGFDSYSFFDRRKVIDVLGFEKDGKPLFGADVFVREDDDSKRKMAPEQRIVLEYSAEATVRCNWDDQYQKILYDHLEPTPSRFGRGVAYIPDGSVEGLELVKGRWKHISKVFNDVMTEEQTQIEPVLNQRAGKNLNGKQKKATGY